MSGQMTIFDLLYPERINPIREVARRTSPYWTTSRNKLIDQLNKDPDINTWSKAVKDEYCPYGYAGGYGYGGDPNTLEGWTMRTNHIVTEYYDEEGKRQERAYSWADFAREIADMIWCNEYKREVTE